MTRKQWDDEYDELRLHLMNDRGVRANEAWSRARVLMEMHRGPRPGEIKLPLKWRLALWGLRRQLLGIEPTEVTMFWKKLIVSVGAGLTAGFAAAQPALADQVITGNEWGAIITAGVIAAYGAFKSNTTWIAPARKGESITKFGPPQ